MNPCDHILYSGAAAGAEACFGEHAEEFGVQEVNFTFPGHKPLRTRGLRPLTPRELALKDVSVAYISKIMGREYSRSPLLRKLMQSLCWQVSSGGEVFIIGSLQEDGTVKGGTGWGAEYAKIRNRPLHVFDQDNHVWFVWKNGEWAPEEAPVISNRHFAGSGTRSLSPEGEAAIRGLFERTFKDGPGDCE
jgi:hypothetical protein